MKYAFAAIAATVMTASPAAAATIVQTASSGNGPAYVARFDTTIGTLTKVTVESSYFYRVYLKYAPIMGVPVVSATGTLGSAATGLYDFTGAYQSVGQTMYNVSVQLSGTAQGVTTSDFGQFTSLPFVALYGALGSASRFEVDGEEVEVAGIGFPGDTSGRFTVTYEFTPAVPEPGTWALMLAGFAMTGYALRRRRAVVAFA